MVLNNPLSTEVIPSIDPKQLLVLPQDASSIPEEKIETVQFEIKDIPGRGKGMIATQDIMPGSIILREKPFIVMPDKIFSLEDSDQIEEWLEKRLLKMSSAKRKIFFDLADSRSQDGLKTILGIFFTNDMTFVDDSAALFPTMARVNHSCRPNADFVARPKKGVQDLVATKLIKEGEEIFISYLPAYAEGSAPRKVRQKYMTKWYGFACKCPECNEKRDDKARTAIIRLHKKKIENLQLEECHNLIEKLIQIGSKLPHQNLVCTAGFDKALATNDWKKAVQFFAAGYINDAILNEDEVLNQWNFVTKSEPISIEGQIYLFPAGQ